MVTYISSQKSCMVQKLNGLYFQSCGLSAKGFNMLHAFSITMSHKTMYWCIEQIALSAHSSLANDIIWYPWFGSHDNINISFCVYEKWLTNPSHFDSGTTATIIVIKDLTCKFLNPFMAQEQLITGSRNPILGLTILDLDTAVHSCLGHLATYHCKGNLMIEHNTQILARGIRSILDKYNTADGCIPCKGDPKRKF